MYKLWKKTQKNEIYQYGIKEIEMDENPFRKPCFLSVLAINQSLKDTNGSINRILEFSGVRNPEGNEIISIENIDVNFMGISFSNVMNQYGKFARMTSADNTKTISDETKKFVEKYLLPLVSNNSEKLDINECKKNMRNVNIACYCDALYFIHSINNILIEKMLKIGFTNEEIDEILAQIFVIPITTEFPTLSFVLEELKFTTISLLDQKDCIGIDDEIYLKELFNGVKEIMYNSNEVTLGLNDTKCENQISQTIIIDSNGEHTYKYLTKGICFPAFFINMVVKVLNNSITNHNTQDFIDIRSVISEIRENFIYYINLEMQGKSRKEMLNEELMNISYSIPSKDSFKL